NSTPYEICRPICTRYSHIGHGSCLYSWVHAQRALPPSDVGNPSRKGTTMLNKCINTMLALGIALAFVVALWISSASADTISFDLGTGNIAIAGFTGPYAHVQVDLTSSTTATFTFTSLTNGGNIYLMGDGGSVGANVNGAFTLGSITGSNAGTGFSPGPYSNGGAGNEDGFGSFNLTINSFDGYTSSSDTILFSINKTSGTWAFPF